ncbi:MAG: murein biosynthesis integral membrane protein MurJ [Nitrosomonadales bacterium]|nr:murein biosynthesis integral membrane protein MurJ [Nitrosomonadales bacterium]|tara:strand:+ start:303 stop:1841 length:1539 start_codon:yes stop_codon:yes gene_type:complete
MNLFKTLASVGGMTTISRILGFIRDSIIARVFGVGIATDAFFVAFKIPNLLRRISAEGAFTQAFVPILAEYKTKKSKLETNLLISKVASLLGIFLVLIAALGVFGAPWLIYLSAPGFVSDPQKFNLTVDLLKITFPYIFFISLVSMAGGILNTYGKFVVPAFTPVWLNISFIIAALFFSDFFEQPIKVLAWAVFFGGVLQLVFQIPFLKQIGCIPKFNLDTKDKGVWRILKLMGPAVIGVSIMQISLLINTIFASFLSSGSVSWLYYADRLMEFPAGVLGVALSTILLPNLSKSFSKKKTGDYSELINWGLRFGILLAVPAAIALAILAIPLISTLFYYGAFTKTDILMTQYALVAYSIGLVGLILIKILAPAFYAQQNIKTPVKIALFTLFCTQFMNLIFIGYLKHTGLALAIGLGACINAGLLFYNLKKGKVFKLNSGWPIFLSKIIVAAFIMALGLIYFKGSIELWVNYSALSRFSHLIALILFGTTIYFLTLKIFRLDVTDFFKKTIH